MRVSHAPLNNEINVTPFLDVLLVLLVIFLASMQARRTMDVQLPVPAKQDCEGACESIVLEVLPNGRFALNREQFGASELRARISGAFNGRPESILFVKGDPAVKYQDIVAAMDAAKGAGVKVLGITPKVTQ
jgi:biopolymer transport protein TolR